MTSNDTEQPGEFPQPDDEQAQDEDPLHPDDEVGEEVEGDIDIDPQDFSVVEDDDDFAILDAETAADEEVE